MRGSIIGLDDGGGVISGDDGKRYNFQLNEYKSEVQLAAGKKVDFEVKDDCAVEVYSIELGDEDGERLVSALLAIFLGAIGVHKFYLGYTKQGLITLVLSPIGLFVITGIVGLIEGIIYISKSDNEFKQIYIDNSRPWF